MSTLILEASDLALILRLAGRDAVMDRMIEKLASGLSALHHDEGHRTTARSGFVRDSSGPGVLEWMPHHQSGRGATIKTVAYTPTNPLDRGLPTIIGTVARYDDVTGRLVTFADAVILTALRTGAASAVASRLLASPESSVVGLIGAGAQAVTQLHALSRVFDLSRVMVYDVNRAHAESFADRTKWLGLEVDVMPLPRLVSESDIICTATTTGVGDKPVFTDLNMCEHVHVNSVGSDLPGKTELPLELLKRALVCPDLLAQARREGECQRLSEDEIGPELPELCARPELAESARYRPTVFDSTGTAFEDHVAVDVAVSFAREYGVGRTAEIEYRPADALDPYPDPVVGY